MISNIKYNKEESRQEVLGYLKDKNFKVVDVGGSMGSFVSEYLTAVVDVLEAPFENVVSFQGNINQPDVWKDVEMYVKKNGKFDFAICTHTLEDISNPFLVCNQLEKIAKAGFIAVPSKYVEFKRFEGNYRGYIHHRWIYNIEDNKFVGYPKVNFIENDPFYDSIANRNNSTDLSFWWDTSIDFTIVNNDYLGPDVESVIMMYKNGLSN